jgi:hypothetical protein
MYRIHPKTGERFEPHLRVDGCYQLADPKIPGEAHHRKNAIFVRTKGEVETYLARGYSLRMRGVQSRQVNQICAGSIVR